MQGAPPPEVEYVGPPTVSSGPGNTIDYVYAAAPQPQAVAPLMQPMKPAAEMFEVSQDIEAGLRAIEERLKTVDNKLAILEGRKTPLLGKKRELDGNEKKHQFKMHKKDHRAFIKNFTLALRVAFWTTVFGLPTYQDTLIRIGFGDPDYDDFCGNSLGMTLYNKANVKSPTGEAIQCGLLPDIYNGYWSTVTMAIVFSVYQNLGCTTQLCWQGFIGTFWACCNNIVLAAIWPKGAADPDTYSPFIAWADLVIVIILLLLSGASTNTIKFGLSTHICLMVSFMNPNSGPNTGEHPTGIPGVNWDNEAVCWYLTSCVGSAVALLACAVPFPLLNISEVDDICKAYCLRTGRIFDSVVTYICGSDATPEGAQISARIIKASGNLQALAAQNEMAWWEGFGIPRNSRKVEMYKAYEELLTHLQSVMTTIRRSITEEDFTGNHTMFFTKDLEAAMHDLVGNIKTLSVGISDVCEDATIEAKEVEDLKKWCSELKQSQERLYKAYITESAPLKKNQLIAKDLGSEHTVLYCLVTWGRLLKKFAHKYLLTSGKRRLSKFDEMSQDSKSMKKFMGQVWNQIKLTWVPEEMFALEQIVYTARNATAIMIAYIIAMEYNVSMFTQYSSVMPMTLTMLISRQAGTTFFSSSQRLMGVTLGKVIPLLMVGIINVIPCTSPWNPVGHAFMVLLYMTGFLYMYFTSLEYAKVGMFAAAYGCSFLFVPCMNSNFQATYKDRYIELGQIAGAIVIQQLVDFCFEFKRETVRYKCVEAIDKVQQEFQKGYKSFFEKDYYLMDEYTNIKTAVLAAEAWIAECDPALEVCPGWETPFKNDLYAACVDVFHILLGDFFLLALGAGSVARKGAKHEKQEPKLNAFYDHKPLKVVQECLSKRIDQSFEALKDLLSQVDGTKIQTKEFDAIMYCKNMRELDGLDDFIKEINQSFAMQQESRVSTESKQEDIGQIVDVRLQVAIHGLDSANNTLADLMELITEYNTNC